MSERIAQSRPWRLARIAPRIARGIRFALLAVLAAGLGAGLSGCGQSAPVPALRESGAEVKIDRSALRNITAVRFPEDATNEDLEPLTRIEDTSALTDIDLAGADITDEGLKHLTKLENLRVLDLSRTPITDEGLETLAKIESLRELSLSDTRITGEGLLEWIEQMEQVDIVDLARPPKPTKPEPRTAISALRFGIDLAGGTNLIYQVDREAIEEEIRKQRVDELLEERQRLARERGEDPDEVTVDPTEVDVNFGGAIEQQITGDVMDQMVGAVARRLNPSGTEEITVRRVGADRIEVIIPRADPETIERKKDEMTRLGSLEFAILATSRNPDHRRAYEQIIEAGTDDLYRPDGSLLASWRDIGVDKEGRRKPVEDYGDVYRDATTGRFLVYFEQPDARVTGEYLRRVYPTTDENAQPAVGFIFDTAGATRFANLTSKYRPDEQFRYRLAILLDERIHSAPAIQAIISDSGQITGRFTQEEIQELINVLNAGALAVPIEKTPVSEQSVSPLLGQEVREQGLWAIAISGLVVFVFMLAYYRFAGLIANLCLILNIVLVMGTMALIEAALTLPGLAGIVLTIGMAVDTNVLIFERMREERARGSSSRMAIQNGFGKALSAIIDSNLTTLITAVVLYTIGTDQIRGFAVTLFIGIIMSMFTALYFGRLIFDIVEKKRWVKEPVSKAIFKTPNWDFLGKRWIAIGFSAVFIAAGMTALFARGREMLDIDFSGGTMITFRLTEAKPYEAVTGALRDEQTGLKTAEGEPDTNITVEQLAARGEVVSFGASDLYRVRTRNTDSDEVERQVKAALEAQGLELRTVEMDDPEIEVVPQAAEDEAAEDGPADADQTPIEEYRVRLEFQDPVRESKIARSFTNALLSIQRDDPDGDETDPVPVYRRPEGLFRLVDLQEAEAGTDGASPGAEGGGGVTAEPLYTAATLIVRPPVQQPHLEEALARMRTSLAEAEFESVDNFDSSVAGEMQQTAIMAIAVSLIGTMAYLWFRFQRLTFGLAAVAAVFHDVLFTLGAVALAAYVADAGLNILQIEDFKISLAMVAAFLTIVGYSLNDTIVIFDRVREVRGKSHLLTDQMVNTSLNQCLSRTLLTSVTTWVVVAILYWFGGEGIHGFAFCLVVGVLVGTYSTVYIANPVLLWLTNRTSPQAGRAQTTPATTSA